MSCGSNEPRRHRAALGRAALLLVGTAVLTVSTGVHAQGESRIAAANAAAPKTSARPASDSKRPPAAPGSARAQALFDPTGYWVSLVTRDWRFRMLVPGRGEYQGIPLSLAGKQFADSWNPATDEAAGKQCSAYGAGAVMLIPERLHISWQNDDTLLIETDAGMQKRLLHFKPASPQAQPSPSWQGHSRASWIPHQEISMEPVRIAAPPPRWGSLKVITTHVLQGLLRKNGVAYSAESTLTEYIQLNRDPIGSQQYLIDVLLLRDPVYMNNDYHYTATFKKEPDGSKWDPTPCSLTSTP